MNGVNVSGGYLVAEPAPCPVCNNEVEEGEYVDIGVSWQKVTPNRCHWCGWVESSDSQDNSAGFTVDQARHLWELQITPYPEAFLD